MHKSSLSSITLSTLATLAFLIMAILTGMVCISLMISDTEHLFASLLAIYISSSEEFRRSSPLHCDIAAVLMKIQTSIKIHTILIKHCFQKDCQLDCGRSHTLNLFTVPQCSLCSKDHKSMHIPQSSPVTGIFIL